MSLRKIELTSAIEFLRAELRTAIKEGEKQEGDDPILFDVDGIEVEFQCTMTYEGESKAKLKFFVIDGEAGGKIARETVQTIRIKLKPMDSDGKPRKVSDVVTRRR